MSLSLCASARVQPVSPMPLGLPSSCCALTTLRLAAVAIMAAVYGGRGGLRATEAASTVFEVGDDEVLNPVNAGRVRLSGAPEVRFKGRIGPHEGTGTAKFGASYKGGGKGIIDSQKNAGGWPELRSLPAPQDTDRDGMPDAWEKSHGLNPTDPADGARAAKPDDYTNLEIYLNSLVLSEGASGSAVLQPAARKS